MQFLSSSSFKPNEFSDKIFDALGAIDPNLPAKSDKKSIETQMQGLLFPKGNKKPEDQDVYKKLKKIFSDAASRLKNNSELQQRHGVQVFKALNGLKKLYEIYRNDTSTEGIIKRNDVLEALSVAYRKTDSLNTILGLKDDQCITRVAAKVVMAAKPVFTETSIPLVRFEHMESATKALKNYASQQGKKVDELDIHEVQEALGELLFEETVPYGALVDQMYAHGIVSGLINYNIIKDKITDVAGKIQKRKNATSYSIVEFFKKLNISVETTFKNEQYSYREMFKKSLHEEESNDAAFQRAMTPEAVDMLLKDASDLQDEITRTSGGNLVISNSFNRLAYHVIKEGGVSKKFNITGKLLEEESEENREAVKSEQSYTGRFAFSLKNMFGSCDDRETGFERRETQKPTNSVQADRLLLDCMTNMLDREATSPGGGVVMAVQRLAPADIHHFFLTSKGKKLTRLETCKVLEKMIQRDKFASETRQLQELLGYFKKSEGDGNDNSKGGSTINIEGTRDSVNRKALYNESKILAQNMRKIMAVQHDDGTIAFHAFIGATSVNNVDVVAKPGDGQLGEAIGRMGFGNENGDKSNWQPGLADQKLVLATSGNSVVVSDSQVTFSKEGSTVISLYLSKDIIVVDKLEEFSDVVRHKILRTSLWVTIHNFFWYIIGRCFGMAKWEHPLPISRSIEVQADYGHVIAHPTQYVAFNMLQKMIGKDDLERLTTVDGILAKFVEVFNEKEDNAVLTASEKIIADKIKKALEAKKSDSLLTNQEYLLNKVRKALENYLLELNPPCHSEHESKYEYNKR